MKDEILNMTLHQQIQILGGCFIVTRIVGGWLYCKAGIDTDKNHSVFVPLSEVKKDKI